jgi:RNA polymerase sigma factor (sigma-70 family)
MALSSVKSRRIAGKNLTRARQGDRAAFSALAEPYRRELIAYCYRLTGKLTESEDLAQEVLVRAFKAMETFEARASTRAWLYKIAHNLCINHVQRSQPDWDSLDEVDSEHKIAPAATAEEEGQGRENVRLGFVALLESLPPRQRAALVLRDVLGWSAEESARILEMTVPAVKNALARARKSLALSPYGGDPANVHDFASADPAARALVADWVDAFEKGNTARMVALLTEHNAPKGSPKPPTKSGMVSSPGATMGPHAQHNVSKQIQKDPSSQSSPTGWGEEARLPGPPTFTDHFIKHEISSTSFPGERRSEGVHAE